MNAKHESDHLVDNLHGNSRIRFQFKLDNSALHGVMELSDKTRPHIFYAHGKVATVLISMFSYTHVLTMLFFFLWYNIPNSQ